MPKESKDKHFIKKPYYEGGPKAMREFITGQMQYPADALKKRIEGTVTTKITINQKGQVTDAKVIGGLGHGCDEEALRLVRLLKFKVGKMRKIKALFHKTIRIHFRLPKTTPQQIRYLYTKSSKPDSAGTAKREQKKGGSYEYTIRWH